MKALLAAVITFTSFMAGFAFVLATQPTCEFGRGGFCSVMIPGTRTELDAWIENGGIRIEPQTYDR